MSFLNSFYFETASLIYTLLLVVTILYQDNKNITKKYYILIFIILTLLTTAKVSNIYFPIITIPFICSFKNISKAPFRFLFKITIFIFIPIFLSLYLTHHPYFKSVNGYHSMFMGTLTFSKNPEFHLQKFGISDGLNYIGKHAYSESSVEFIKKYSNVISHKNSYAIILKEPHILLQMMKHGAENMQNISLEYLGKQTYTNPGKVKEPYFNLWTKIKNSFFPKGYLFFAVIFIFLAVFFTILKVKIKSIEPLIKIGLISVFGIFFDMFIAIFGDGKFELKKTFISIKCFV